MPSGVAGLGRLGRSASRRALAQQRCYSTPTTCDAIVVGAGVFGSSISFELSKKGWKTINVDQGPAAGAGSSSASCGIIRTMYSLSDSVKLAFEGYHLWQQWADHVGGHDESGTAPFVEMPYLLPIVDQAENFKNSALPHHDALGIPYELIDGKICKERFPYFDLTRYGGAKRIDDETFGEPQGTIDKFLVINTATGFCEDPCLAAHNLMRAAEAAGARFQFRSSVDSVLKTQGRVSGVKLADGSEIHAPLVINAAGPWSAELNRLAFADGPEDDASVKTRPMRVEVAYPPCPAEMDYDTNGCVATDFDTGVYIRPASGGRLTIGSIDPPCDHPQHDLASVAEFEDTLGHPWERQIYRAALRMPSLPVPNTAVGVSHMYDKSDDFTPIYDKTSLPGFYTAIGTSGNQFKNCGVAGKVMAELIERCEGGHDHDNDPLQIHLPLSQQTLDMRTFSRLRKVATTSGGVLG